MLSATASEVIDVYQSGKRNIFIEICSAMAPISKGAQKELKNRYDLLRASRTRYAMNRYCTAQQRIHLPDLHTLVVCWRLQLQSMKLFLTKVVIDEMHSFTVEK